jgi:hypothetical protein
MIGFFRNKLVPSPNVIMHKLIFFMQRWPILSSGAARGELDKLTETIKAHIPLEASSGVAS